jgi:PAS domain S-box-containing protein
MVTALFAIIELIQKKLQHNEETFRGIIEKNPEGFLMANEYGVINYMCPSVHDILGYEQKELWVQRLQNLFIPTR